jgi:hypothetical protein
MEGFDQDRDMDVVIRSLHATIDKIVATAIRLATNNNLQQLARLGIAAAFCCH